MLILLIQWVEYLTLQNTGYLGQDRTKPVIVGRVKVGKRDCTALSLIAILEAEQANVCISFRLKPFHLGTITLKLM